LIGRIKGILLDKKAPDLLVDVNGVGYELQAPMSTFYQLPAPGQGIVLHTHLVVREDAQLLYGFHDEEERLLFRSLIKVNGIGPKVALAILSGVTADEFVRLVRNNDVAALTKIPGIGKKTAERLLVDMRDRLAGWQSSAASRALPGEVSAMASNDVSADAETALISLGYKPAEAARMVLRALRDNPELGRSEDIIRLALKGMI
jgi:holliday junction DNA helicase RuvA